jgi:type IV pilus assembly protein PilE
MISDRRRSASIRARASARGDGFTLIEVMIAIVVVGILTAIALPQYTIYVQRSRVVDGTSAMNDIRTRQEQFFQDRLRYDDGGGNCGFVMPALPNANFTYNCVPAGAPALSYTVTATGVGQMAGFVYNIIVDPQPAGVGVQRNTVGVPSKWLPLPAGNCWQVRPGGHC